METESASAGTATVVPATDSAFTYPMLATDLSRIRGRICWRSAVLQEKLDGWRCIASKRGGYVYLFTRSGSPIRNCPHIQRYLEPRLEDGETFDGELYRRGLALHQITSRLQRHTLALDLQLHVFDCVQMDLPFPKRLDRVRYRLDGSHSESPALVVRAAFVSRKREALNLTRKIIRAGGEGAVLRLADAGYRPGVRSRSVVKVKRRHL